MAEGSANGGSGSFTTKEIVIEIRDAVNKLADKVDRIDRTGSIGTRQQLDDHEKRVRVNEARLLVLEDTRVKREEMHAIRNDIAAVRLALADRPEQLRQFRELEKTVDGLSTWRWRWVGVFSVVAFVEPIIVAVLWHHFG